MSATNQPIDPDIPGWKELLWSSGKQRKAAIRLTKSCNLMWWWLRAQRLLELAETENVIAAIRSQLIGTEDPEKIRAIAKTMVDCRHEVITSASASRPKLDAVRFLLHAGMLAVHSNLSMRAMRVGSDSPESRDAFTEQYNALAPFILWSRKLYGFDPTAWELIMAKPLDLTWNQATGLFDAFPNNILCIEVPEHIGSEYRYLIGGAWKHPNKAENRLLLAGFPHTEEHLHHVETPISWLYNTSTVLLSESDGDLVDLVPAFLCAAAYLHSRPEDRVRVVPKAPKKLVQAQKLLKTQPPEVMEVGISLGQSIRLLEQQRDAVLRENAGESPGRRRPVPHWRAPHHAVYWTGPGRAIPVVKWVDAVIVNKDLGAVGVIRHNVTK